VASDTERGIKRAGSAGGVDEPGLAAGREQIVDVKPSPLDRRSGRPSARARHGTARASIRPTRADPHGGGAVELARRMIRPSAETTAEGSHERGLNLGEGTQ